MRAQHNPPPSSSFNLSDWGAFSHSSFFPTDSTGARKVTYRDPTATRSASASRRGSVQGMVEIRISAAASRSRRAADTPRAPRQKRALLGLAGHE
jgi:hypothetical protein